MSYVYVKSSRTAPPGDRPTMGYVPGAGRVADLGFDTVRVHHADRQPVWVVLDFVENTVDAGEPTVRGETSLHSLPAGMHDCELPPERVVLVRQRFLVGSSVERVGAGEKTAGRVVVEALAAAVVLDARGVQGRAAPDCRTCSAPARGRRAPDRAR